MLVNKEIARKLRDIGFNDPTDYFYNPGGDVLRNDMDSQGNEYWISEGLDGAEAPDKSDVFAWFRKKGFIGAVNYWVSQDCYYFSIKGVDGLSTGKYLSWEWEEAEDKCILKMIELHG